MGRKGAFYYPCMAPLCVRERGGKVYDQLMSVEYCMYELT